MDRLIFEDLSMREKDDLMKSGQRKLSWARAHMPVLNTFGRQMVYRGALKGARIAMALHTEAKTGILAQTLARAGAEVRLVSCNPLSTDDATALALSAEDVSPGKLSVRARKGLTKEEYYSALNWALDLRPQVLIDDGADLVKLVHTERQELLPDVIGGCEETTTGIMRLRSLEASGKLMFPMVDINDCMMKHLFDNRYGTGQSVIDGLLNATNLSLAGMRVVVAGYGWCGKGIASRLKGMGAIVTVTEVDPVRAVEALMDGFEVGRMWAVAKKANMVLTATGCKHVVHKDIIEALPNGCVLGNLGHFDNEIDVASLRSAARRSFRAREHVEGFEMEDGRTIYLVSEGRLVNLAAGQGHPVEIMDLSFALQASGAELIFTKGGKLPKRVIGLPREIDEWIAMLKLSSVGCQVDDLSKEQKRYLSNWEEGT